MLMMLIMLSSRKEFKHSKRKAGEKLWLKVVDYQERFSARWLHVAEMSELELESSSKQFQQYTTRWTEELKT